MKFPAKELRAYVYGLLNNMVVGGKTIPVKSVIDKRCSWPVVELSTIETFDESAKDYNITRCNFNIRVYTRFADENASYTQSENICNEVVNRLNDVIGNTASFAIFIARFTQSIEGFEQTETDKVIYNQLIFEYQLQEL